MGLKQAIKKYSEFSNLHYLFLMKGILCLRLGFTLQKISFPISCDHNNFSLLSLFKDEPIWAGKKSIKTILFCSHKQQIVF